MVSKSKSRSGTQWSEADYAASGYARINLRISKECARKLGTLAKRWELSRAGVVELLVLGADVRAKIEAAGRE